MLVGKRASSSGRSGQHSICGMTWQRSASRPAEQQRERSAHRPVNQLLGLLAANLRRRLLLRLLVAPPLQRRGNGEIRRAVQSRHAPQGHASQAPAPATVSPPQTGGNLQTCAHCPSWALPCGRGGACHCRSGGAGSRPRQAQCRTRCAVQRRTLLPCTLPGRHQGAARRPFWGGGSSRPSAPILCSDDRGERWERVGVTALNPARPSAKYRNRTQLQGEVAERGAMHITRGRDDCKSSRGRNAKMGDSTAQTAGGAEE